MSLPGLRQRLQFHDPRFEALPDQNFRSEAVAAAGLADGAGRFHGAA